MAEQILKKLGIAEADIAGEVQTLVSSDVEKDLDAVYRESIKNFQVDTILKGKILGAVGDDVLVDIAYKSEGVVPITDFIDRSTIRPGETIEVFLEMIEGESGVMVLSKAKADRIRGWERIISEKKEGDVVRGRVTRKIKGGLLVDVGVPVFLPASQVDIRRVEDIGEFFGKFIDCKIIKIDEKRMNIIVSRRRLLEELRQEAKLKILDEIKEGDIRRGVVKNISDFGAFVDLGGIDGLLHITDMSWGRVSHPSEIVALEQELQVKILKVERERERIALGLKQLTPNPWEGVAGKYLVGAKVKGKVVNILPYGAFVELEHGVEGLVHVSEMSWTKRINHPSEVVSIGDSVNVVVLNVDMEKHELSLGLKQTEANPWDLAEEKYQPGTKMSGKVRSTTSYGAFVELDDGLEGLLHVNDMSWTRKIVHPTEVVKKGEKIEVAILSVDKDKKRIALGLKQLSPNPWETVFPEKYTVGNTITGRVAKLVSFGAFVELEKDLEGLLHISKVAESGSDEQIQLAVGDVVEVKVVKFDPQEGKIGLSLIKVTSSKAAQAPAVQAPVAQAPVAPAASDPATPEAPAAPSGAPSAPPSA